MSSASLDFRWSWLRTHHVSTYLHVGSAAGWVLDRADGSSTVAKGVRFGAGMAIDLPVIRLLVDASEAELALDIGPSLGVSKLSGITIGAALH